MSLTQQKQNQKQKQKQKQRSRSRSSSRTPHPHFSVVPPTRCLASSSVRASGSPSSLDRVEGDRGEKEKMEEEEELHLSRVAAGREEKAALVGAKTVRGDCPSSRSVLVEKATPRAVTRVENLGERLRELY